MKGAVLNRKRWPSDGGSRIVWLTGLSGAGKTTIAQALQVDLMEQGIHSYVLDGDLLRQGLCRDLGFSPEARTENIRRISEVANLFSKAGVLPIVAAISPYSRDRALAREIFPSGNFIEVHVDTPLEVCKQRDPKGLYRRVQQDGLKGFTGIDAPYEVPVNPEIHLRTENRTVAACVAEITGYLGLGQGHDR